MHQTRHLQFFSQPETDVFRVNQHWVEDNEVTSFSEEIKLYSLDTVRHAAEEAGLRVVNVFSDYLGTPFQEDMSFMSVVVFTKQERLNQESTTLAG